MNPIHATLNHIALDVVDRDRSARFYGDLLGARVIATDDEHGLSFLRLPGSQQYSDIALHQHPDRDAAYPAAQLRMAHTGWAVEDPQALVEGYERFAALTRVVFAADFGVAVSVMGLDPDGHTVELEHFTVGAVDVAPGFRPLDLDGLRERVAALVAVPA